MRLGLGLSLSSLFRGGGISAPAMARFDGGMITFDNGVRTFDQDVEPSLTNTAAPTISSAVIGTPMEVTAAGTYNEAVTSVTYDWQVNGVSMGATYTPVEADRTANITVVETVTGAVSGDPGTATSAASVCRRTEPSVAYNFGAKTPTRNSTQHFGKVRMRYLLAAPGRYCLGPGVTAPTTWALDSAAGDGGVISGTAAHWDWVNVGDGNTCCRATGGAAISGTYVFRTIATFSDGVVEYMTVSITAKANTFTVGDKDMRSYGFVITRNNQNKITAVDLAGDVGRVEFAVGFYIAEGETFAGWDQHQPTNRVTITWADVDRAGRYPGFYFTNCQNLDLVSLRTVDSATVAGTGRLAFLGCTNFTVTDYQHLPDPATAANKANGIVLNGNNNGIVITNPKVRWVTEGITQNLTTANVGIRIYSPEISYFDDNGMILGGDSATAGSTLNDIIIYDPLIFRPVNNPSNHIDYIQISDTANGGSIKVLRAIMCQAAGTGKVQGYFAGGGGDASTGTLAAMDLTIRGMLIESTDPNGVWLSKGNDSVAEYIHATKTTSTNGGATIASTGPDFVNDHGTIGGSLLGTNTFRNSTFKGSATAVNWTDGGHNIGYAGTENAAHYYSGMTPRAYLAQWNDADWLAADSDTIRARMKAAFRPAVGSVLDGFAAIDAATGDWNATLLAAT